jgi:hypothetical protein
MIPPKKAIGPSNNKQSTPDDRIYRETVSKIFFIFALVAPTFRTKQLA